MTRMSAQQPGIVVLMLLTASCATIEAPVDNRQTDSANRPATVSNYDPEPVTKGYHQVSSGDTLYSIAWRYGLDYRDVADWNKIPSGYVIYPGQKIRLIPDQNSSRSRVPATTTTARRPVPATPTVPARPDRPPIVTSPPVVAGRINWQWPTNGTLLKSDSPTAKNGIDVTGTAGQAIYAAADGIVVYSGSGLLGYGKLIIVKHSDTYLSAYAHNQNIHIKEGDKVMAGQTIATMGIGRGGKPMLHFEIRKDGKPANPLLFLPRKS